MCAAWDDGVCVSDDRLRYVPSVKCSIYTSSELSCVFLWGTREHKSLLCSLQACVCVPLLPDQAIPAAINAHITMCKPSYLMHYQLVHWHSILDLPCASLTCPPSDDQNEIVKRFPVLNTFHSIWFKLTDILHDAVTVVLLICAVDTCCAVLCLLLWAIWAEVWRHQWVKLTRCLEHRELFTCVSESLNN